MHFLIGVVVVLAALRMLLPQSWIARLDRAAIPAARACFLIAFGLIVLVCVLAYHCEPPWPRGDLVCREIMVSGEAP